MSRLTVFLLVMVVIYFLPVLVYADCDEYEDCGIDWNSKSIAKRNGLAQIECDGGGIHYFDVTKYVLDDVGPDHCIPGPMVTYNIIVPPGEEAEIDWPGYIPIETDPLNAVTADADCWDPVTKTTNYYKYVSSAGTCPDYPSYNDDLYYTEVGTQTCCD